MSEAKKLTVDEFEELPWLHVFGQYAQHSEMAIRGTTAGLIAIRDAINLAISGGEGKAEAITSDGEGYHVLVYKADSYRRLGSLPYIEIAARELDLQERAWKSKWRKERGGGVSRADDLF